MLIAVMTHGDYTLWRNTRGRDKWSIDKRGTNKIVLFRTKTAAMSAWNNLIMSENHELMLGA